MNTILIKLNAGNDNNGNPRRCFVAIDQDQDIIGVYDEGYHGNHAVPKEHISKASQAPVFMVTPKEYKECLKLGKELQNAISQS